MVVTLCGAIHHQATQHTQSQKSGNIARHSREHGCAQKPHTSTQVPQNKHTNQSACHSCGSLNRRHRQRVQRSATPNLCMLGKHARKTALQADNWVAQASAWATAAEPARCTTLTSELALVTHNQATQQQASVRLEAMIDTAISAGQHWALKIWCGCWWHTRLCPSQHPHNGGHATHKCCDQATRWVCQGSRGSNHWCWQHHGSGVCPIVEEIGEPFGAPDVHTLVSNKPAKPTRTLHYLQQCTRRNTPKRTPAICRPP